RPGRRQRERAQRRRGVALPAAARSGPGRRGHRQPDRVRRTRGPCRNRSPVRADAGQGLVATLAYHAGRDPLRARHPCRSRRVRTERGLPQPELPKPVSTPTANERASMRQWLATSPHPSAAMLRRLRRGLRGFTLPAPRVLVRPYLWLFLGGRALVFGVRRLFIAEPLFKAYCTRLGRNVTTGIYVPWIQGKGDLEVGDDVHISGKLSVSFAARFSARPRLVIGAGTDIAHDCRIVVGKQVTIGRGVELAGGVTIRDSGGHP